MPTLRRGATVLHLEPGTSVLEALVAAGLPAASSCRIGACQSCLQRATSGDPGAASQQALPPALREQGYFLACISRPTEDLLLDDGEVPTLSARVHAVEDLGAAVLRVLLRPDEKLDYRPGQYVNLVRPDGLSRAYSLASLPEEDLLELHVRVHPQGAS